MEIRNITPEEYEAFGKDKENWNFLNSVEQGRKMEAGNWNVEYIGAFEEENLKGTALLATMPLAKVYQYAYIPRGFLLDWSDTDLVIRFVRELKSFLKKRKVMYLMTNPYLVYRQRDAFGHIIEDSHRHEQTVEILKKEGFLHVPAKAGYAGDLDVSWQSVLDIQNKSAEQLLKEMDQQTRWSINRAAKYDLSVEKAATQEQLEEFAKMMAHTGQRNHFEVNDASYYKNTLDAYGPKAELLLCYMDTQKLIASQQKLYDQAFQEMESVLARLEQTPNSKKFQKKQKVLQEAMDLAASKIKEAQDLAQSHGNKILLAGSLFCFTDREMVYLYSGAYDEFLKYNAPYAIHYQEIKNAISRGMERYNFYGISGNFEKDEEGYPLFMFKKGFGCIPEELVGNFYLPVRSREFALYNALKKIV